MRDLRRTRALRRRSSSSSWSSILLVAFCLCQCVACPGNRCAATRSRDSHHWASADTCRRLSSKDVAKSVCDGDQTLAWHVERGTLVWPPDGALHGRFGGIQHREMEPRIDGEWASEVRGVRGAEEPSTFERWMTTTAVTCDRGVAISPSATGIAPSSRTLIERTPSALNPRPVASQGRRRSG